LFDCSVVSRVNHCYVLEAPCGRTVWTCHSLPGWHIDLHWLDSVQFTACRRREVPACLTVRQMCRTCTQRLLSAPVALSMFRWSRTALSRHSAVTEKEKNVIITLNTVLHRHATTEHVSSSVDLESNRCRASV